MDCRRHRLLAGSQDCLSFLQMQCDVCPTIQLWFCTPWLMVCWCLLLCSEFCNEAQRQSTCHVRPSVSPPPCRRDQEDPLLKATTGPAEAIEPLDPSDPTLMRAHVSNVKVVGMPYTQVGGPPPVVVAVAAGGQTALGGIRKTKPAAPVPAEGVAAAAGADGKQSTVCMLSHQKG